MMKRLNADTKKELTLYFYKISPNQLFSRKSSLLDVGISLFSHPVARALSSAPQSLTSVFGMGTGGPSVWERVDPLRHRHQLKAMSFCGSPNWARTSDIMINSHALSLTYIHTSNRIILQLFQSAFIMRLWVLSKCAFVYLVHLTRFVYSTSGCNRCEFILLKSEFIIAICTYAVKRLRGDKLLISRIHQNTDFVSFADRYFA